MIVEVVDGNSDAARVEDVAEGSAAAATGLGESRTCLRGDIREAITVKIAQQNQSALRLGKLVVDAHTRSVDRAADNQNVGTAIIVEINKTGAPLYGSGFAPQSGGNRDIVEEAFPLVVIEARDLVGEIRLDDIE